jgi:hypothetical protein
MDTAIAIGQGAGLAVACGVLAGVPLALAALLAYTSLEPGRLGVLHDTGVVIGLCAFAILDGLIETRLPRNVRIGVRAVAGAAVFELVAGKDLPIAGIALGFVLGGLAAIVALRILERAARAGSSGATAAIAAAAALVASFAGLVPFVGYVMAVAVVWLYLRARRREGEKYAGLRILR